MGASQSHPACPVPSSCDESVTYGMHTSPLQAGSASWVATHSHLTCPCQVQLCKPGLQWRGPLTEAQGWELQSESRQTWEGPRWQAAQNGAAAQLARPSRQAWE